MKSNLTRSSSNTLERLRKEKKTDIRRGCPTLSCGDIQNNLGRERKRENKTNAEILRITKNK